MFLVQRHLTVCCAYLQALLTASEGPDGPLALQLYAAIVMGVAGGGAAGGSPPQRPQTRPPAEAVCLILPPADPERPFGRLCTLMQVRSPPPPPSCGPSYVGVMGQLWTSVSPCCRPPTLLVEAPVGLICWMPLISHEGPQPKWFYGIMLHQNAKRHNHK